MTTPTSSSYQDEDENLSVFKNVIAVIDFGAIPQLCASVRQEREQESRVPNGSQHIVESIPCKVCLKPLFGSFNILYKVEFADGVRWLVKIPADGYRGRWDQWDAEGITSEALTMQLVRSKTTIPVPEVFSYRSTIENELNCPFILMEFIEGISLHEFWFDTSFPLEEIERRRIQALGGVASVILQLNQFRFHEGGSIVFQQGGDPKIGPVQYEDQQAMLDRPQNREDEDETPIFFSAGPFQNQKEFFTCQLDRRHVPEDKFSRGFHKLLQLFISWIPYTDHVNQPSFVLAHPDFDIQNFIVSPEGRLRGVIDWDGVGAIPDCLGNERYPSWLTRDWDPAMYGYRPPASLDAADSEENLVFREKSEDEHLGDDELIYQPEAGRHENSEDRMPAAQKGARNEDLCEDQSEATTAVRTAIPEDVKENSPEELNRYREIYQGFIAALAKKAVGKAYQNLGDESTRVLQRERLVQRTRNSLMIDNLSIAASTPMCQDGILRKIFEEIEQIDRDKYDETSNDDEEESEVGEDEESTKENIPGEEVNDFYESKDLAIAQAAGESNSTADEPKTKGADEERSPDAVEEEDSHEDHDEDPVEFFDLGSFTFEDVALALADGELDETRLARLKAGFAAFCS